MRSCFISLLAGLLLPALAHAHSIQLASPLPAVQVSEQGELQLQSGQTRYQGWDSQQLPGKVRVIQHIAGRSHAKELNAPLIEAIKAAKLPHDRYQTTTIVNLDDALFGTGGFVVSSVEKSKAEFPWSSFVLDEQGVVRKAWDLQEESSAIVVLDKDGKVRFVKDGALSPEEIATVMTLLHSQL
ncbi:YtfJ family protein [Pseudaeromonas sharmana]|uniref:YtfJ family protein n=1 Tax=Pseudaeromonas sharmana TaxID=328412 RepID=A0ABV8CRL8_9GAMM